MKYLWTLLLLLSVVVFGQAQLSEQTNVKFGDKVCKEGDVNRDLTMSVGDSKEIIFKPELRIDTWGGECLFKLDLRSDTTAMMSNVVKSTHNLSDKITMTQDATVGYSMYKRADGNFEWEIILTRKPDTNLFEWKIETSGYEWVYQPTIAEEPLEIGEERPDSVEGSYAVYHATKGNDFVRIIGKDTTYETYGTSKAFHVYRVKVIDDKPETSWCVLNVDTVKNKLSITVPQKFLDDAKYQVIIDPTFGHSSEGASTFFVSFCAGFYKETDKLNTGATDYKITELHIYAKDDGSDGSLGVAAYTSAGGAWNLPLNRLATAEAIAITSSSVAQFNVTGLNQALAQSTWYGVCLGNPTGSPHIAYDWNNAYNSKRNNSALPSSWTHNSYDNLRYSAWATYEEAGEPEAAGQVIMIQQ